MSDERDIKHFNSIANIGVPKLVRKITSDQYKSMQAKPRKAYTKKEESVHEKVCQYLDKEYPGVIYTSDSSGVKLTIGQATKLKKLRCKKYKIPDLLILAPNKMYSGLIIEIKTSNNEVYTKSGQLRESEHIQDQNATLHELSKLGYMAVFGCGYDNCVEIIEHYFRIIDHYV
jgi:hypothetical protein